jgi:hypothetical protein
LLVTPKLSATPLMISRALWRGFDHAKHGRSYGQNYGSLRRTRVRSLRTKADMRMVVLGNQVAGSDPELRPRGTHRRSSCRNLIRTPPDRSPFDAMPTPV